MRERHYFICREQLKRPTAIPHTSFSASKRRGKHTCHYPIPREEEHPKRQKQPRRKRRKEQPQEAQKDIRRQRVRTTHFTYRGNHRIEPNRREDRHDFRRVECRDLTGGISGEGKRVIATFPVFIQAMILSPVTSLPTPAVNMRGHPEKRLRPSCESGASPQGNGWSFSGKRWEFRHANRGKAGCLSGNGYIPKQSEGRLRECVLLLVNLNIAGTCESRN